LSTEDNVNIPSFTVFSSGGNDLHAAISLVLDNSGSIDDTDLQDVNNAALGLVNLLEFNDEASVFKFTEHVELVQNFTNNKDALEYAVTSPRISGNMTAFYDGIYDAISLTKLERARKAVVALTDGIENSSIHNDINEVINYAVQNQIPIFTIGLGGNVNESDLQYIAESTGGLYFASATTENLAAIFESIGGTIDNQYEIQYTTPNPTEDCSERTTSIQVNYNGQSDQKSRVYNAPCEGEIRVELPKDTPCFPGDSIVLQILIEDVTGADIRSYQFTLQYNPNVLSASGARSAGTLTASWGDPVVNNQASDNIRVGGFGVDPLQGSGVLVEVTFDVIGQDGDYSPLTFLEFIFNAGNPPVDFIDGFVWVTSLELAGRVSYYGNNLPVPRVNLRVVENSFSDVTGSQGDYLISNLARGQNYTLEAEKAMDTDIGVLSILTHDAAYTAQAAIGIRTLDQYEQIAADVDKNNSIQMNDAALIAKYAVDLPKAAESHVGEWHFEEPQLRYEPLEGSMKNQNFTAILIGDVTDNWNLSSANFAKANYNDIYELFDDQVGQEIQLNIDPFIDDEFSSMDISLAFDSHENEIPTIAWSQAFDDWKTFSNYKEGILHLGAFALQKNNAGDHFIKIIFDDLERPKPKRIVKFAINGHAIALQTNINSQKSPASYKLEQNYPNPFNPSTIITYSLEKPGQTEISIFNSIGQQVRILQDNWLPAGTYKLMWDALDQNGEPVSPGIYFIKMSSGSYSDTKKIVYIQ